MPLDKQVRTIDERDRSPMVNDVLSSDDVWHLSIIHSILPCDVKKKIMAINSCSYFCHYVRYVHWREGSSGSYTVKSGYDFVTRLPFLTDPLRLWMRIWKLDVSQKFHFFL